MKKSEAVRILQAIAFESDELSQFVEIHMNGDRVYVSISMSRPYSVGGGPSLGSEEGLLMEARGSTLAKAVAALVKRPEYSKTLMRAEEHRRRQVNQQQITTKKAT